MTIEQINELSELTDIAVVNNDIESLTKIYKLLIENPNPSTMKNEWFVSSLTSDQWQSVLKSINNK